MIRVVVLQQLLISSDGETFQIVVNEFGRIKSSFQFPVEYEGKKSILPIL